MQAPTTTHTDTRNTTFWSILKPSVWWCSGMSIACELYFSSNRWSDSEDHIQNNSHWKITRDTGRHTIRNGGDIFCSRKVWPLAWEWLQSNGIEYSSRMALKCAANRIRFYLGHIFVNNCTNNNNNQRIFVISARYKVTIHSITDDNCNNANVMYRIDIIG